jgi:hypothetical protein
MSQSLLDFLGHQQAVALPAAFSKMRGFGWRELGEVRLCLRLAYLLLRRSGEGRSERLLTGADVVDPGFSGAAADFAGGLAFRIRGLGRRQVGEIFAHPQVGSETAPVLYDE